MKINTIKYLGVVLGSILSLSLVGQPLALAMDPTKMSVEVINNTDVAWSITELQTKNFAGQYQLPVIETSARANNRGDVQLIPAKQTTALSVLQLSTNNANDSQGLYYTFALVDDAHHLYKAYVKLSTFNNGGRCNIGQGAQYPYEGVSLTNSSYNQLAVTLNPVDKFVNAPKYTVTLALNPKSSYSSQFKAKQRFAIPHCLYNGSNSFQLTINGGPPATHYAENPNPLTLSMPTQSYYSDDIVINFDGNPLPVVDTSGQTVSSLFHFSISGGTFNTQSYTAVDSVRKQAVTAVRVPGSHFVTFTPYIIQRSKDGGNTWVDYGYVLPNATPYASTYNEIGFSNLTDTDFYYPYSTGDAYNEIRIKQSMYLPANDEDMLAAKEWNTQYSQPYKFPVTKPDNFSLDGYDINLENAKEQALLHPNGVFQVTFPVGIKGESDEDAPDEIYNHLFFRDISGNLITNIHRFDASKAQASAPEAVPETKGIESQLYSHGNYTTKNPLLRRTYYYSSLTPSIKQTLLPIICNKDRCLKGTSDALSASAYRALMNVRAIPEQPVDFRYGLKVYNESTDIDFGLQNVFLPSYGSNGSLGFFIQERVNNVPYVRVLPANIANIAADPLNITSNAPATFTLPSLCGTEQDRANVYFITQYGDGVLSHLYGNMLDADEKGKLNYVRFCTPISN